MADRRYIIHYTEPDGAAKRQTHETEDVEHVVAFDSPPRQYAGVPLERNLAYLDEIGAKVDMIQFTSGEGAMTREQYEASKG